jgi:hypothetical protein
MQLTIVVAAAIVVVIAMFVVLFYQTASVRWVIEDIERRRMTAPQDADVPLDIRQCVKAYAVVAARDLTRALQAFVANRWSLEEDIRMSCDGRVGSITSKYKQVDWLVLERSDGCDALWEDAMSGKIKYAAIGGALVRIVGLELKAWDASFRVFALAAAYDVLPKTMVGKRGRVIQCYIDALMPIASDMSRLRKVLAEGPNDLSLHIWAYGWGT